MTTIDTCHRPSIGFDRLRSPLPSPPFLAFDRPQNGFDRLRSPCSSIPPIPPMAEAPAKRAPWGALAGLPRAQDRGRTT
jgi:hypothetical protein